MKELNGVWWTGNKKKISGTLKITDDNTIYLTTYEPLYDIDIINGYAEGQEITLIDNYLDRIDTYHSPEAKEDCYIAQNIDMEYKTYRYISETLITGFAYERKGDIRLETVDINFTNLEQWMDSEREEPGLEKDGEKIKITLQDLKSKKIKYEGYAINIQQYYIYSKEKYKVKIESQSAISIQDIYHLYINEIRDLIYEMQCFMVLCTGNNINVEKIRAKDMFQNNLEIILGYGKSNYENRSKIKNIIKYKDIEENIKEVLKNWTKIYSKNELLVNNFIRLQKNEDILSSEYINLMSAIDSLYLAIHDLRETKESFFNILKELLNKANFILNLSEEEIGKIANKVKEYRRYYIRSNKKQRDEVNQNLSLVQEIISFLIEIIRIVILLEIGVKKEKIEESYKRMPTMQEINQNIVEEINPEEEIIDERIKKGRKIVRPLSKKDRELVGQINARLGMRHRTRAYDLENKDDIIELAQQITAEYMDMSHYYGEVANIAERFDQSLEIYHPEKWAKLTTPEGTGNPLIDNIIQNLNELEDDLYELADEVENEVREIWTLILETENKEVRKELIGDIEEYTKEERLQALEDVIEDIFEVEYNDQVQKDTYNFAKAIKEVLEINRKENEN